MFDAFCPGKRAHERKKGTSQSPEVLQARMVGMWGTGLATGEDSRLGFVGPRGLA